MVKSLILELFVILSSINIVVLVKKSQQISLLKRGCKLKGKISKCNKYIGANIANMYLQMSCHNILMAVLSLEFSIIQLNLFPFNNLGDGTNITKVLHDEHLFEQPPSASSHVQLLFEVHLQSDFNFAQENMCQIERFQNAVCKERIRGPEGLTNQA